MTNETRALVTQAFVTWTDKAEYWREQWLRYGHGTDYTDLEWTMYRLSRIIRECFRSVLQGRRSRIKTAESCLTEYGRIMRSYGILEYYPNA